MKFNRNKVGNLYSAKLNEGEFIEGSFDLLEYGWYESGKAFIAKNGRVLTLTEAFRELVPKTPYGYYDSFFCKENGQYYKKTIDGIVRYLIEKYNK